MATQYIDHRTYDPGNGQSAADFFGALNPGTAVAGQTGKTWGHDQNGWYWNTPDATPAAATPTAPVDPYVSPTASQTPVTGGGLLAAPPAAAPAAPTTPAPAATSTGTPTFPDPFTAQGGGVWLGEGWVPKDHPLAATAGAQQPAATTPPATTAPAATPTAPTAPAAPATLTPVDHRTYQPPNGQTADEYFATLQAGTPVPGQPGQFWVHTPTGWATSTDAGASSGPGFDGTPLPGQGGGGPNGQLNISVQDAPAFNAPTRAGATQAMPTLGAVDAYTGPTEFRAPTAADMANDPGYQVRLRDAMRSLEASASARGTLLTGPQREALMTRAQEIASNEYQNTYNRSRDTFNANVGLSTDAYDRSRLERDARFGADTGNWQRDATERGADYDARFAGAQASFAPQYDTWAARQAATATNATSNFNRGFDLYKYNTDDSYRRWRDSLSEDNAMTRWTGDDSYRRDMADLQNRQFLATLGAQ